MPSAFTGGMQERCPRGGGSGLVGLRVQGDAAHDFKSVLWEECSGEKEATGFGDVKWKPGPTLQ